MVFNAAERRNKKNNLITRGNSNRHKHKSTGWGKKRNFCLEALKAKTSVSTVLFITKGPANFAWSTTCAALVVKGIGGRIGSGERRSRSKAEIH